MLKRLLLASALFISIAGAAFAEWPLAKMNAHIDATNWIVDDHCSGVTLDAGEKLILTNFHCIDDWVAGFSQGQIVDPIYVAQKKYEDYWPVRETRYAVWPVGYNKELDLAVIQIADSSVKLTDQVTMVPDSYKITRGEQVFLVGNPTMLDSSVIEGNVAAEQRNIPLCEDKTVENPKECKAYGVHAYFQVTGGVVGGASGGTVYNTDGLMMGVVSAANSRAAYIGFAIPVSIVKKWLQMKGIPFHVFEEPKKK